ncbi:MAG: alanine racemase, partial [Clostridia bacterium]|nr:alanine racemase [Clostridia bacterium]
CCNSAAIHRFPEMALDMVRAGISLYGYPPVPVDIKLRPCMKWCADISYIKEMPAEEYVSYGRTYKSSRLIRVATITCGYGDGYFRKAGEKGYVLIGGKRAKIIGRVCMDQMMVDITDIKDVSVGDEAVLIGESGKETISAEDIASWAGTISYEVLLSVGSRVDRIFRE